MTKKSQYFIVQIKGEKDREAAEKTLRAYLAQLSHDAAFVASAVSAKIVGYQEKIKYGS